MRTALAASLPLLLAALASAAAAQQPPALRLPQPSPAAKITQTIGITEISIEYSRPGVKGRKIWGGLVPYGELWRTGANAATAISFGDAVKIAGKEVPAGRYAVLTIPGPEKWTVILNKNDKIQGTQGYDPKDDAVRVEVAPKRNDFAVEWMTFCIDPEGTSAAKVSLWWENLSMEFSVDVDVAGMVGKQIAAALETAKPDDWRIYQQAANFYANAGNDPAKAASMIEKSVSIKETYQNLFAKAEIEKKAGRTAEAVKSLEKALGLARTAKAAGWIAEMEKQMVELTGKKAG